MSSIATLTIDLIGKSGKLSAELKKATKNTQSWADKTRKLVGTSTKAMVGFGAAGVAAYASIYAKNAEFIDLQAKTADRYLALGCCCKPELFNTSALPSNKECVVTFKRSFS